eukprot:313711-Rhodomonas_salina.1
MAMHMRLQTNCLSESSAKALVCVAQRLGAYCDGRVDGEGLMHLLVPGNVMAEDEEAGVTSYWLATRGPEGDSVIACVGPLSEYAMNGATPPNASLCVGDCRTYSRYGRFL